MKSTVTISGTSAGARSPDNSPGRSLDRRVSVAPMMGWTDKHDRYFLRLISPHVLLYTVMITTGAIIYGKKLDALAYNPEEHPLALQLGGSDPQDLAACAKIADKQYGYDEINLNCGCPSDRVQRGKFGACLMAEPDLVADCVDAMKQSCDVPVTVKCRIGIDNQDSYDFLLNFVGKSAEKGCDTFIIHARKALLNGLSPADNRTVPPLKWETAYRLKRDFPQLNIILNGGVKTVDHIREAMQHLDGVMIGREAYSNPYLLADIERDIYDNPDVLSRHAVVAALEPYVIRSLDAGVPLKDITRHILGLYQGERGAKRWRQILSQQAYQKDANLDVIRAAQQEVIALAATSAAADLN